MCVNVACGRGKREGRVSNFFVTYLGEGGSKKKFSGETGGGGVRKNFSSEIK